MPRLQLLTTRHLLLLNNVEDVLDDAKSPGAATPTDSLASDLEPSLEGMQIIAEPLRI
jgi:hypothetical protein